MAECDECYREDEHEDWCHKATAGNKSDLSAGLSCLPATASLMAQYVERRQNIMSQPLAKHDDIDYLNKMLAEALYKVWTAR